jgi:hypothetical protein
MELSESENLAISLLDILPVTTISEKTGLSISRVLELAIDYFHADIEVIPVSPENSSKKFLLDRPIDTSKTPIALREKASKGNNGTSEDLKKKIFNDEPNFHLATLSNETRNKMEPYRTLLKMEKLIEKLGKRY